MTPRRRRDYYIELYEKAKTTAPKNPDGSVNEADLLRELANLVDLNLETEKARRAKGILNSLCRPRTTPPGQTNLEVVLCRNAKSNLAARYHQASRRR